MTSVSHRVGRANIKTYRIPVTYNPSRFCLSVASHTRNKTHLCYQCIKQHKAVCFIYDSGQGEKQRSKNVRKIASLWQLLLCADCNWSVLICFFLVDRQIMRCICSSLRRNTSRM